MQDATRGIGHRVIQAWWTQAFRDQEAEEPRMATAMPFRRPTDTVPARPSIYPRIAAAS